MSVTYASFTPLYPANPSSLFSIFFQKASKSPAFLGFISCSAAACPLPPYRAHCTISHWPPFFNRKTAHIVHFRLVFCASQMRQHACAAVSGFFKTLLPHASRKQVSLKKALPKRQPFYENRPRDSLGHSPRAAAFCSRTVSAHPTFLLWGNSSIPS